MWTSVTITAPEEFDEDTNPRETTAHFNVAKIIDITPIARTDTEIVVMKGMNIERTSGLIYVGTEAAQQLRDAVNRFHTDGNQGHGKRAAVLNIETIAGRKPMVPTVSINYIMEKHWGDVPLVEIHTESGITHHVAREKSPLPALNLGQ